MMNYKKIESTDFLSGQVLVSIQIQKSDQTFMSFPADNSNPNYISFLRQLSEENPNDPHYLAWVEAGNNPEDFWTRDLDSPEGLEQPKEETEGEG